MKPVVLGIIPARAGSQRLPNKNIKPLGSKPLIVHTIQAAQQSKLLDSVIVASDGEAIIRLAKRSNVDSVMLPNHLTTNTAGAMGSILYALDQVELTQHVDVVVLLQPTSPLRSSADIDKSVRIFLKSSAQSLVSVRPEPTGPWISEVREGHIRPILGKKYFSSRSQDLPKCFVPNGAIYITRLQTLRKYKTFYTPNTLAYIMPRERSIDIDDQFDFTLAQVMIRFQG